jgi:hypothetical protein
LLLVAEAQLGAATDRPAIFIQLQSERECGSAGCNTSVYLERNKKYVLVLDSVGGTVSVDSSRHNGLRDLIVGKDDRWIWNGKTYVDTRSAPDIRIPPKAAPKPPKPKPAPAKPEAPPAEAPKPEAPEPAKPATPAPGPAPG